MANLTDRRFDEAKLILDRRRKTLLETGFLDAHGLERELRQLWGIGYQALKGIMIDLSNMDDYVLVAAKYMESGCPGVVSEFKPTLAKLYGIRYYHAPEMAENRQEFWDREMNRQAGSMEHIFPMPAL